MTTFVAEVHTNGSRADAVAAWMRDHREARILKVLPLPPTPNFQTRFEVTYQEAKAS